MYIHIFIVHLIKWWPFISLLMSGDQLEQNRIVHAQLGNFHVHTRALYTVHTRALYTVHTRALYTVHVHTRTLFTETRKKNVIKIISKYRNCIKKSGGIYFHLKQKFQISIHVIYGDSKKTMEQKDDTTAILKCI